MGWSPGVRCLTQHRLGYSERFYGARITASSGTYYQKAVNMVISGGGIKIACVSPFIEVCMCLILVQYQSLTYPEFHVGRVDAIDSEWRVLSMILYCSITAQLALPLSSKERWNFRPASARIRL